MLRSFNIKAGVFLPKLLRSLFRNPGLAAEKIKAVMTFFTKSGELPNPTIVRDFGGRLLAENSQSPADAVAIAKNKLRLPNEIPKPWIFQGQIHTKNIQIKYQRLGPRLDCLADKYVDIPDRNPMQWQPHQVKRMGSGECPRIAAHG